MSAPWGTRPRDEAPALVRQHGHASQPITEGRATTGRRGLRHAIGVLRLRPFRWWFLSQIGSGSGSMTQTVGMSWLVLRLTDRGVDLGLLTAAAFLPTMLGGAWCGALVDRFDRRRLLIGTQGASLVLGALLAVLTWSGATRLWMVFATALASGCVTALDGPARQVYVLELVGREHLTSAVSLNEIVTNLARVLGPALGGVLLATAGTGACFALNALTFVPPLLVLSAFRPAAPRHRRPTAPGQTRAGLRYAASVPAIRAALLLAIAAGFVFNLGVALPLVATCVFHLGAAGYGAMMAAFGCGAIGGALLTACGDAWPTGRRVRVLAVATGVLVIATAYASARVIAFAGLFAVGVVSIWFISLANTMAQVRADPTMRGRVMGAWSMALPGSAPVTGVLTGWVAEFMGARPGFALGGAALLGASALTWRSLNDGARETTSMYVLDGVDTPGDAAMPAG
jgi:MFS family permease